MQERWTSIWGHIDELRQTLLRSLFIIGLGFLVILGFYQPVIQFFTANPLERTENGLLIQQVQRNQVENQTTKDLLFDLPSHSWLISASESVSKSVLKSESESGSTPISQNGNHNSYRLKPGESLLYEQAIRSPLLIMGPIEGLILAFKVCFWLSIVLTAPLWGWIWLQFILPGLRTQERSVLFPFLLISILCLGLGAFLAYSITLPLSNQYLALFNSSIGQNAWTLTHYVNYVLLLYSGHAIAAELGLLLLALVHFRFLSPTWLIAKRRYMIVVAFILGALLTPPDVLTQLLLAFPLMGLYEIAILYAKWRMPKCN